MTFPLWLRFMRAILGVGRSRFGRADFAFALVSDSRVQKFKGFPRDFSDFRATFAGRAAAFGDRARSRLLATETRPAICIIQAMDDFGPFPEGLIEVPQGLPDAKKALAQVYLLGPIRILRGGQSLKGGWRRKSLELLAYLGVHPDGVSKDQILEALWPKVNPADSQRYFWQSASYLRRRLCGNDVDQRILWPVDDLYRLDTKAVWVDVHAFENAIVISKSASNPELLLHFACDIYKGEFCDGSYFSWATGTTDRLRDLFIVAAKRLSVDLQTGGNIDRAIFLLDKAVEVDPCDEDLYRRAMALEAKRGRRDQVVRRYRRLRRLLLADLGVEPSPLTVSTFNGIEEAKDHCDSTSWSSLNCSERETGN